MKISRLINDTYFEVNEDNDLSKLISVGPAAFPPRESNLDSQVRGIRLVLMNPYRMEDYEKILSFLKEAQKSIELDVFRAEMIMLDDIFNDLDRYGRFPLINDPFKFLGFREMKAIPKIEFLASLPVCSEFFSTYRNNRNVFNLIKFSSDLVKR